MHITNKEGRSISLDLPTDSATYHVLSNAAKMIKGVPGIVCEIGTRRGGSLEHIVNGLLENQDHGRNMVCIDPYGNIEYERKQGDIARTEYTNDMRIEAQIAINAFLLGKPINVVYHCLEDTEFFVRYGDGVPFYNEVKIVETEYAFVFFDGPHGTEAVMKEIEFFHPRAAQNSVWVFDDWQTYDHAVIENWIFERGWRLVEQTHSKASYTNKPE
jgi:cephalosporin hydroxylase